MRRNVPFWLVLVLSAAGCGVLGYYHQHARLEELENLVAALRHQLDDANQRAGEASNRLIALEQERAIDAVVKEQSKNMLEELQGEVQRLTRDLAFYKGIMAPDQTSTGLQISLFEVRSPRSERRYPFKLVLAQVAEEAATIEGQVEIVIEGRTGSEKQDFRPDLGGGGALSPFKFRYFQDIEGEVVLPEGFAPEQILVRAQAKGNKNNRIERTFSWEF